MAAVLDYLPRGNTLSEETWQRRHRLLQGVLLAHLPLLLVFGLWQGIGAAEVLEGLAGPAACLLLGRLLRNRRLASLFISLGLVSCSAALVAFSDGMIEAHFHFFIIIGFIALYQDWVPFLLNILFTVMSHGIGSSFVPDLMFNHAAAQGHPWRWSLVHGVAVLAACVGVVLFWRTTEEEQNRSLGLTRRVADLDRRRFTSDLLVNLARRNQNLLYRQMELLHRLEEEERDPDSLSNLFQLDHLATRIRRNAESLLVLSGEESPRTWRGPVPLVDVVSAAIAEIEDMERVDASVDESLAVSGRGVADLTHLLAELLENAVHFSPPGIAVQLRTRPYLPEAGAWVLTIEDWGVGMTPTETAEANALLRQPTDVDLSTSQRLGLHVAARLAARYGISVELTPTPGGGVTAVIVLPAALFVAAEPMSAARAEDDSPWVDAPGSLVAAGSPRAGAAARPTERAAGGPAMVGPPGGRVPAEASALRAGPPGAGNGSPVRNAGRPSVGAPHPGGAPRATGPGAGGTPPALPRRAPGGSIQPATEQRPSQRPAPSSPPAARTATPAAPPPPATSAPAAATGGGDWSSWWTRSSPKAGRVTGRPAPWPSTPDAPTAGGTVHTRQPTGPARPALSEPAGRRSTAPAPTPPAPTPPAPTPPPPAPAARPEPRPPADGAPRLSRRVPQANLAAGLRREPASRAGRTDPETGAVVRDAAAARDALSRFQASQRAARSTVEGDGGPSR